MAKKELGQDITEIGNILNHCSSDQDILENASNIEKHTHKIKGLAPMMGQEDIGQIAALLDNLLKSIDSGKPSAGSYQTVRKSYDFMKNVLNGASTDFESLKTEIEKTHKSLLQ